MMKGLRIWRKRAGLSQWQLANKMGVHPLTISKWECGTRFPEPFNLERLARALNCQIADLFEGHRIKAGV